VQLQLLQLFMVLVLWIWRLSCALPLDKECSTCLELLLQLASRVYMSVIVLISESLYPTKVMVLGGGWVKMVILSMVKCAHRMF
jgi:hypothetical protein